MKKIISLKEIMVILISVLIITLFATTVNATGLVLGDGNENATTIPSNEYENAQNVPVDNNTVNNVTDDTNNTTNKTTNNAVNNTVKKYNTSNKTDLPQTGIEDYNVGILLIICVASAIYAYKKVNDYRNI